MSTQQIRTYSSLFLAVALLIGIVAVMAIDVGATQDDPTPPDMPNAYIELPVVLHRVGLSAEKMAAAGVAPMMVSTLVSNMSTALDGVSDSLEIADFAVETYKRESNQLRRTIQSGRYEEGDPAAYQQALTQLETAETDQKSILDGLFAAATEGLTGSQTSTLQSMHGNDDWNVLLPYKTLDLEEADWVRLRNLLAIVRIAEKNGESPDGDAVAALALFQAEPSVVQATASLEATGDAVEVAWDAATNQGG